MISMQENALGHHFSEVPKAELVTRVPERTQDNNFAIEVAPVEQSVNVFQLTHWLVLVKIPSVTDQRIQIAALLLRYQRTAQPMTAVRKR
ncbi:hypothetical protein BN2475_880001 [Paraburkholderia ribeironis]|uniref:Uncharacterized protein n=1 Tax=Paraburkholderia ribeironis TaxID=1247936 RepID=A0A1N7SKT5_9BURK|nr:hypothetical protein BN2475_880001 [Paraburkholderia ribeironis]